MLSKEPLDAKLNKRGGKRAGAGRKPKADEIALIEKLKPLQPLAFKALEAGLKAKDYNFTKLYLEYFIGKAKERLDVTTGGESLNSIEVRVLRNVKYDPSGSDD